MKRKPPWESFPSSPLLLFAIRLRPRSAVIKPNEDEDKFQNHENRTDTRCCAQIVNKSHFIHFTPSENLDTCRPSVSSVSYV